MQSAGDTHDTMDGITRRSVLKRAGAVGAVGAIGGVATVDVASAAHCRTTDEEEFKDEVYDEDVTDEDGDCGELRLASATDLAYMREERWSSDDGSSHVFLFVTEAAAEWRVQDEQANAITYHQMDVTEDTDSAAAEFSIDFCDPRTGVDPASGDDADALWKTIAEAAVSEAADSIGYALTGLNALVAISDALTNEDQSATRQMYEVDRQEASGDYPHETKFQGTFEVNVPDGTSGYVEVLSKTEATGPAGDPFCKDNGMWNRNEDSIYIQYDSTGGSQTIYLYDYDPRF